MTANPETLDSSLENSELLQIKKELSSLYKEVKEWVEPSVTPEKMKNGKVLFNYKKDNQERQIITEKSWDTYKVRIKKRIDGAWYTQKFWDSETYNFTAKDKDSFKKELWNALDKKIGTKRDRLPNTGWKVYDMLNAETNKQESKETNQMPKWLVLDHWTYVYTVQSWDCESKIKSKLAKYSPLSYLKNVSNGIWWYNFTSIPDKKLLPWLKITVPKPDSERIKTISSFKASQKSALNEMKNNSTYWDDIKKLLKKYSENHIVNVMTAYAKSETCPEDYDDKVWRLSLFRYEKYHQCASYWYHHVLYEGSGKTALKNTWLTIWQSCDPKWSWELFLAFCIEKVKWVQKKENRDFSKFFDMNNVRRCAQWYNWVDIDNYSNKLKKNYDKIKSS